MSNPEELVQSLFRGLLGFEQACKEGSIRSSAFAQSLDVHRSTALRLLNTLEHLGYLWKDEGNKSFYPHYENLLDLFPPILTWIRLAESAVKSLCEETGRTTNIGFLEGSEIVYVMSRLPDPHEFSYIPPGTRNPCYATALGKAILAYKTRSVSIDTYISMGLIKPDSRFPLNRKRLSHHLSQIRQTKYAVDDEDFGPGIRCIAAPIFDYENKVIAALGISGTVETITSQMLPDLASHVVDAADKVTDILRVAQYIDNNSQSESILIER